MRHLTAALLAATALASPAAAAAGTPAAPDVVGCFVEHMVVVTGPRPRPVVVSSDGTVYVDQSGMEERLTRDLSRTVGFARCLAS